MSTILVGIPSYNNSMVIEQTLKSLKNQTYADWECIISDDNSDDSTVEVIKNEIQEDKRFRLIMQDKRLGASENWNYLLSCANTKYFKLLHADDLLQPNNLEVCIQLLEKNDDCVLISSNRKFSKTPRIFRQQEARNTHLKMNLNKFQKTYLLKGYNFVGEPSFVIFKTKNLKDVGGFKSNWKYLIDMDTYFRVLQQGTFIKIRSKLGAFRVSANSWSYSLLDQQLKEEKDFLNHISNSSKLVNIGLFLISIRSFARKLYFKFSK